MTDPITTLATSAATTAATTAATKGTTKLLDLLFSKHVLKHKRLETLSDAQNKKDAKLIEQGLMEFRDGKFVLIDEQVGNPTSPLGLILSQHHQNQSENLGKCLSKTYEHLSEREDEEINDEQISDTFFNKWMNYSKEVSEEELQDLWGNILAKEITEPNSINFLVLNTLSLMSKNHLQSFYNLISFICDGHIYCNPTLSAHENYKKVNESTLNELVDLNIIKGFLPDDIYYSEQLYDVQIKDKKLPIIYIDSKNFIAFHLYENTENFQPYYYPLTSIGKRLFKIALNSMKIEEYFVNLISSFQSIPAFKNCYSYELISLIDNEWQSRIKIDL